MIYYKYYTTQSPEFIKLSRSVLIGLSIFAYLTFTRIVTNFLYTRYSIVADSPIITMNNFMITPDQITADPGQVIQTVDMSNAGFATGTSPAPQDTTNEENVPLAVSIETSE